MNANNFTQALERCLEAKGWNKTQLAREMDIANSSISRWLKGSAPTLETLHKLASVFGVDVNTFIQQDGVDAKALGPMDSVPNRVAETGSTYHTERLINPVMIPPSSGASKRQNKVQQVAQEIASRLEALADATQSERRVLKEEINTRVAELERFLDFEAAHK